MKTKKHNIEQVIKASFNEAQNLFKDFLANQANIEAVEFFAEKCAETIKEGKKIISCGNGGSMCDAMHFAEELTGRFRHERIPLPAVAISDPSHLSCTANDYGYDSVFSRFVEGVGNKGDILLGISTSGNSANVIKAVETAKKKGMFTICLLGRDGGKLKDIAEHSIIIPAKTSDRVQELHVKIIHVTIEAMEKIIFPFVL